MTISKTKSKHFCQALEHLRSHSNDNSTISYFLALGNHFEAKQRLQIVLLSPPLRLADCKVRATKRIAEHWNITSKPKQRQQIKLLSTASEHTEITATNLTLLARWHHVELKTTETNRTSTVPKPLMWRDHFPLACRLRFVAVVSASK